MVKKTILVKKNLIFVLVFIVILFIAGGLIYEIHRQHIKHLEQQKSTAERLSENTDKDLLQAQNYSQYQLELTSNADNYTDSGKYDQAERVLKQILKDVPQKNLTSDTYRSFWYLYSTQKDDKDRKHYAQLTADKLKQEGQIQQAAEFEKDANRN